MLPDGKFFRVEEFACHEFGGLITPYPEEFSDRWIQLRDMLDKIRAKWQGSLVVVSGYRSPKHNQDLIDRDNKQGAHGVASGSQHVEGRAADIRPMIKGEVPLLYRIILGMFENGRLPELGGIGIYPSSGWVHVDTHRVDHLRKWAGT